MKATRFIAVIALLAATITACKGKGDSATNDSAKDTVVVKAAKDDTFFKAPLDTIKVETVERSPADTLDARPVH